METARKLRPVHIPELAKCESSPTGAHYWIQTTRVSPIWICKYCERFRAFNVKYYLSNPFCEERFMKLFSLEELPTLIHMAHEVTVNLRSQPSTLFYGTKNEDD